MLNWLKARLVADWQTILKLWSVQWALLGSVLLPVMTIVPSLPNEVQALLPPKVRVIATGVWCLLYIALRAIPQKKLGG